MQIPLTDDTAQYERQQGEKEKDEMKIEIDGYHAVLSPNANGRKQIDGQLQLVRRLALHLILNFLLEISNELIEGSCQMIINQLHCITRQHISRPGFQPFSSRVVRDGSGGIP